MPMKWRPTAAGAYAFATLLSAGGTSHANSKPLISYFQPIPIVSHLQTTGWGAPAGPWDPSNGIEDPGNWFYWDGKIVKGADGTFHLFCSRWPAKGVWTDSQPIHATSTNLLGPYVFKEQVYPNYQADKGHNTTALIEPGGTFAIITSEIVPGWFFGSSTLAGPWAYQGQLSVDTNGHSDCNPEGQMVPFGGPKCAPFSNLSVTVGPDQRFWATSRHGQIMDSNQLTGPYKIENITGDDIDTSKVVSVIPNHAPMMDWGVAEDPVIWYSGGCYHVVFDYWNAPNSPPSNATAAVKSAFPTNCAQSTDSACTAPRGYHLMSRDGIHNWVNTGVAFDPETDFIRYTDGTVNHWHNMERTGVYLENGHPVAFTFVVTSTNKNTTTITASKVLVVPFDGASFDADNGCESTNTVAPNDGGLLGDGAPGARDASNSLGSADGSLDDANVETTDAGGDFGGSRRSPSDADSEAADASGSSASFSTPTSSGTSASGTSSDSSATGSSSASGLSRGSSEGDSGAGHATQAPSTSGCGCRIGGDSASGMGAVLLTMLGLFGARRRSAKASSR